MPNLCSPSMPLGMVISKIFDFWHHLGDLQSSPTCHTVHNHDGVQVWYSHKVRFQPNLVSLKFPLHHTTSNVVMDKQAKVSTLEATWVIIVTVGTDGANATRRAPKKYSPTISRAYGSRISFLFYNCPDLDPIHFFWKDFLLENESIQLWGHFLTTDKATVMPTRILLIPRHPFISYSTYTLRWLAILHRQWWLYSIYYTCYFKGLIQ